ncbi:MAG: hypothetical protein K0Q72_918 [Armatimonadetes bacterium]|nr:hypothetical protein [Armatimonadota bacterium]
MGYQVPADSLFANTWNGAESIADVPETIKAQIREDALLTAFNRLETSLRLLLYATTPGKEPPTPEHLHQILNVWRFELEHRVNLVPDTYCGAVQNYEPEMESAYTIDGRCSAGDRVRIRVPCWRMFEKIVIRGEAEVLDEADLALNGTTSEALNGLRHLLTNEPDAAGQDVPPAAAPETPTAEVAAASSAIAPTVEPVAAAPAPDTVAEAPVPAPRIDPAIAASVARLQNSYEPAAGSYTNGDA